MPHISPAMPSMPICVPRSLALALQHLQHLQVLQRFVFAALLLWAIGIGAALAVTSVDVNTATVAQLDAVRGIGPALSKRILQEREKKAFTDWDDFIARMPGIGQVRAAHLSTEGLKVEGKSYTLPGTTAPPSAPSAPAAPAAPAIPAAPAAPKAPAAPTAPQ